MLISICGDKKNKGSLIEKLNEELMISINEKHIEFNNYIDNVDVKRLVFKNE